MSGWSATNSGKSVREKNPVPISHVYFKELTPCKRVHPNSWGTASVSACPESARLYLTLEAINEFPNLPLVSFIRQTNSSKSTLLLSYHLQLRLQTEYLHTTVLRTKFCTYSLYPKTVREIAVLKWTEVHFRFLDWFLGRHSTNGYLAYKGISTGFKQGFCSWYALQSNRACRICITCSLLL